MSITILEIAKNKAQTLADKTNWPCGVFYNENEFEYEIALVSSDLYTDFFKLKDYELIENIEPGQNCNVTISCRDCVHKGLMSCPFMGNEKYCIKYQPPE